jgi:hypothetical protein
MPKGEDCEDKYRTCNGYPSVMTKRIKKRELANGTESASGIREREVGRQAVMFRSTIERGFTLEWECT